MIKNYLKKNSYEALIKPKRSNDTSAKKKSLLKFPKIWGFVYIWAILLPILVLTSNNVVFAQMPPTPTPTPVPSNEVPPLTIKEAYGFKNIASPVSNDFFVLLRYELYVGDEPYEYWCEQDANGISKYLLNDSGCNLDVPNPDFPFSLKNNRVLVKYFDNTMCGGASCPNFPNITEQHMTNLKIPRIGKGLMGLYQQSPASTTYGFNEPLLPGNVCFEYNVLFFDSAGNSNDNCKRVVNDSNGRVGIADLISGGEGILYNLESDLGLPENTLVSSEGLVTPAGQIYLEEAMAGIVNVAINSEGETVFQLGANRPNNDFNPVGSRINLQENIYATATASGTTENLNVISSQYLGFEEGKYFAAIVFIILGLFVATALTFATNNFFFGTMGGISIILPGIFIGAISIGFLFTAIALFIIFGSWFWIRRSPE